MACKMFLEFPNGLKMPQLGLGTWQAPEAEVEAALNEALRAGYRHIDCAPVYQNEHVIGRVLKEWLDSGKVKRDELFIVTKLPPFGNRPSSVEKCLRRSLSDLQLDYVDLYLIHTPFTLPEPNENGPQFGADGNIVLDLTTDHAATWRVMEEMLAAGLAKNIGVSNFNQKQLQRLLDNCKEKPVNLQVESHVYLQQKELTAFCKANNITMTAYSPLGSQGIAKLLKNAGVDREIPDLMENPVVKEIASKHNKSPAQVLLRHVLDRGLAPIPKSTNFNRLKQNMDVFDFQLDGDDMKALAGLDQGVRVCDFAFFKGVNKHPEFPF